MNPDFEKYTDGLMPVIVQDCRTEQVLMLGYMNREAFEQTLREERVTFYSRSKGRLWTKGETSGNYLQLISLQTDCDEDALLCKVVPVGPVCHTGVMSCFGPASDKGFLYKLEARIAQRIATEAEGSYTYSLFQSGINKVAQKVGEEAIELVIEAKDNNSDLFKNEAADLLYHFLVLLKTKGVRLSDIEAVLAERS